MLLSARAEVLSGYVYDTVCVDIECNLDLRNATTCRSDAVEVEAAKRFVVLCHFTLALENVDFNTGLVISSGGEYLALLCRNCGVSLDKLCKYAAESLDAKGQRSNIKKKNALNVAAENAALDSCANCDALVGVDALERLFACHVLYKVLNSWDSCGAAYKENLAKVMKRKDRSQRVPGLQDLL